MAGPVSLGTSGARDRPDAATPRDVLRRRQLDAEVAVLAWTLATPLLVLDSMHVGRSVGRFRAPATASLATRSARRLEASRRRGRLALERRRTGQANTCPVKVHSSLGAPGLSVPLRAHLPRHLHLL